MGVQEGWVVGLEVVVGWEMGEERRWVEEVGRRGAEKEKALVQALGTAEVLGKVFVEEVVIVLALVFAVELVGLVLALVEELVVVVEPAVLVLVVAVEWV